MSKPIPAQTQRDPRADEHDACALIANVRKKGGASHGNVKRTIEALMMMSHRSGIVEGEGDGCGVLVDIPRRIWAGRLVKAGLFEAVTTHPRFFVGHFMVPRALAESAGRLRDRFEDIFKASGVEILWSGPGEVQSLSLGPSAREEEPEFWQLAGFLNKGETAEINGKLFRLQLEIERTTPIHVASLSADSCVYKIRGSAEALTRYYPELRRPDFVSAITIGHNRYSTNTASAFERVQPFSMLGHNGEINTVARLREEALGIGTQLVKGGSDSQDLNRTMETMVHGYGMTLMEAVEILFPPIISEIKQLAPPLQDLYMFFRQLWGPFSQGPAGIVTRNGDECVFGVDAMGLRPLWYGETEKEYFFSSEKGVIPIDAMTADPSPWPPASGSRSRSSAATASASCATPRSRSASTTWPATAGPASAGTASTSRARCPPTPAASTPVTTASTSATRSPRPRTTSACWRPSAGTARTSTPSSAWPGPATRRSARWAGTGPWRR